MREATLHEFFTPTLPVFVRVICICWRFTMKRRHYIQGMGATLAAATAFAKPALAQAMRAVRWRLTASWRKSLDTLFGAAEIFAKAVAESTDNRFQIQVFAAGWHEGAIYKPMTGRLA